MRTAQLSSHELSRALAALDFAAVFVVLDDEGDIVIAASGDPEREIRRWRSMAKHPLGIALVLWAPGLEAARILAERARARLVAEGFAMKGRWLSSAGGRPATSESPAPTNAAEWAIRHEAQQMRCRIMSNGERLEEAVARVEYEIRRAAR